MLPEHEIINERQLKGLDYLETSVVSTELAEIIHLRSGKIGSGVN